MVNFSDFTDGGVTANADYIVGYAAGAAPGSDRRWTKSNVVGDRSLYGPFINLRTFGAVGDGVTDDTAAFNAAIAFMVARGGGMLWSPKGEYLITAALDYYSVPILWEGEPGTRFICNSAVTDLRFFTMGGAANGNSTPVTVSSTAFDGTYINQVLAVSDSSNYTVDEFVFVNYSDANGWLHSAVVPVRAVTASSNLGGAKPNCISTSIGDATITVTFTAHGRAVGDPVLISGCGTIGSKFSINGYYTVATLAGSDHFTVEAIEAMDANVTDGGGADIVVLLYKLAVNDNIPFLLDGAAATKTTLPFTPMYGGGFRGIEFDASGSSAATFAILATYTAFQIYENLSFIGFGARTFNEATGCAMLLDVGYGNRSHDVATFDCGSGGYDDIIFSNQTNLVAAGTQSDKSAGFGIAANACMHSHFYDMTAEGAAQRGIKIQNCWECVFDYVEASNCGYTGFAISGAATNNQFITVISKGNKQSGLWFAGQNSVNNHFHFVSAHGSFISPSGSSDINLNTPDIGNVIEFTDCDTTQISVTSDNKIFGKPFPYSPTITAAAGAITSYTVNQCHYVDSVDGLEIHLDAVINDKGTASGAMLVTLPVAMEANVTSAGYGIEQTVSGKALSANRDDGTHFKVLHADGTSVFANTANPRLIFRCMRA